MVEQRTEAQNYVGKQRLESPFDVLREICARVSNEKEFALR